MIGWERRVLLRHYLEQGMTKTELAERFGISRQTIYRWIRSGELDRDLSAAGVHYSARAPVATKLDRYRDILVSRLGEYPDLTAVRLFEEIKAAGYAGGYTQVKEYVRKVRPRAPEEPVVRFETPPGHQGQVDFADFRLPWGKRYAFLVVLGFSRVLWLQFFTRQTMLRSSLRMSERPEVASLRTPSSYALRITGTSASERVVPTGRRPRARARSSDR